MDLGHIYPYNICSKSVFREESEYGQQFTHSKTLYNIQVCTAEVPRKLRSMQEITPYDGVCALRAVPVTYKYASELRARVILRAIRLN